MRFARFTVVGAANTAINFAILNFALFGLHLGKITSSVVATTCAIIFSFAMNRSFVFRDRERPFRKFLSFSAIAACGVLAIQTSVYALSVAVLSGHLGSTFIIINLSNLIASASVLFWNYNGYRLFVFNRTRTVRFEGDGINEADEAA